MTALQEIDLSIDLTDDFLLSFPCQRGIFEARILTATPANAHVLSIFNPLLAPFMQRNVFVIFPSN